MEIFKRSGARCAHLSFRVDGQLGETKKVMQGLCENFHKRQRALAKIGVAQQGKM
jgi:hypothetical protein